MVSGTPMTRAQSLFVVAVLLATALPAAAQDAVVGRIKTTAGAVSIFRQKASIPAKVGMPLFQADTIRTGADGHVGITLKDDTRVSLGPNSEVRLNSFLYTPAEGRLGLVLNFVRGMAVYVSGRIAKLAPDSIRLETPGAIVGVRGTTVAIQVVQ